MTQRHLHRSMTILMGESISKSRLRTRWWNESLRVESDSILTVVRLAAKSRIRRTPVCHYSFNAGEVNAWTTAGDENI